MQGRVGDRRVNRATLHYPERRTGFDRRRRDPLRVLWERPVLLLALLIGLNLLSAADWALTGRALAQGAQEANLVLGALLASGPVAAGMFKAATMLAITVIIWRQRRYRLVLATAVGAVGLYVALMVYHVAGLASIAAL